MRKKIPILYKPTRFWMRQGIMLILICFLIALQYLQGAHYAQCICIFPDEILDLPCSISQLRVIDDEKDISLKKTDPKQFIISFNVDRTSDYHTFKTITNSGMETHPMKCFKKRLFILQHYNS